MDSDRFKGVAKEVGGRIEELAGSAVGHEDTRASGVGRQIAGMGQNLYGQAKDNLRDAGERAEQALGDTGDVAQKVWQETKHQSGRAYDATAKSVDETPVKNVLLAAAAGFIIGIAFRRM